MKAIGILGGTFDPIHYGHLRIAQELADGLGLDHVRVIPAGLPPHRKSNLDAEHRMALVKLAIAGNQKFIADDREIRKATPSYTVETLKSLRDAFGASQPLCLLMGADAVLGLTSWHRWQDLFNLAHIVVAHRPGLALQDWEDKLPSALAKTWKIRRADDSQALSQQAAGLVFPWATTALDISATAIRAQLTMHQNPRYLLPDSVLDYIHTHHLYEN